MGWWEARLVVPLVDDDSRDEYEHTKRIETMILARLGNLTVPGGGGGGGTTDLLPPPTDRMEQRTDVYVCVPTVPQVGLKLRGTYQQQLELKLLEKSHCKSAAEKWSKYRLTLSNKHDEKIIHEATRYPEARQRLGVELQRQSRRLGIQNKDWDRFLAALMVAQPQKNVTDGKKLQHDNHPDDGAVLATVTCHKRRWAYRGPRCTTIEVAYLQFQVDDSFLVADGSKNYSAAEFDNSSVTDSFGDTTTKAPSTPPAKRTNSLPPRRMTTSAAAEHRSAISVCIEGQEKHFIGSLLNQLNDKLKDDLPTSCAPLVGSYSATVARIVETMTMQHQEFGQQTAATARI